MAGEEDDPTPQGERLVAGESDAGSAEARTRGAKNVERLAAGNSGEPDRWAGLENPADPGLSAVPGHEKRSYLIPLSVVLGLVVVGVALFIAMPKGPRPPYLVLENPALGFRAEYPSVLIPGPNYVKTSEGSILTVERYSLDMADKKFLAGLPDVLFDQALIQIQENYAYVEEKSRTHLTVDGMKAVEVVMEGLPAGHDPRSAITVDIFANDSWVWILRSYSPLSRDAKERPLFAYFRDHFKVIASSAPRTAS